MRLVLLSLFALECCCSRAFLSPPAISKQCVRRLKQRYLYVDDQKGNGFISATSPKEKDESYKTSKKNKEPLINNQHSKEYSPDALEVSSGMPVSILLGRTLDTIEDVWEHLRRLPYENGLSEITPEEENSRKTIVVLGRYYKNESFYDILYK